MEQPDFNENQLHNIQKPSKNKKKIILLVLLAVIILGVVAVLAFRYGGYVQRQEEPAGEAYTTDASVMNGLNFLQKSGQISLAPMLRF
jgi:flagellar basal body-associated protein FliL